MTPLFRASDFHARLAGGRWTEVLLQVGVPEQILRLRRQQPCPFCGGTDRYVYDNKKDKGNFFCRHCGPGDGFTLLMRLYSWDFREACRRVAQAAGLAFEQVTQSPPVSHSVPKSPVPATPTPRVREFLRGICPTDSVADVIAYLSARKLWPLPTECTLQAHASAEYWQDRRRIGRFAALVAPIRDLDGALVTAHVTYLQNGLKFSLGEPRKILSPMTGRTGCAVRLLPLNGDTLGIAEGLETALSAYQLHQVPVWAALNTSLLAKFEPPGNIGTLIVFADRDAPGLESAARLMERLQGRVHVELRVPGAPAKDFNDVLVAVAP